MHHKLEQFMREHFFESGYQQSGETFKCRCPAHEDGTPSMTASWGRKNKVILNCHKGCSSEEIFAALGITNHDTFEQNIGNGSFQMDAPKSLSFGPKHGEKPKTVAAHQDVIRYWSKKDGRFAGKWAYRDESDDVLYYQVRFEKTNEKGEVKKSFRPAVAVIEDGKKRWAFQLAHAARRVPYNLVAITEELKKNEALKYDQEIVEPKTIWIVEGEKASDALIDAGFLATTSVNGSKSFSQTDWSMVAKSGRVIRIWPDNDGAGKKFAESAVKELRKLCVDCDIRVIDPNKIGNLKEGDDAVEFIQSVKGKNVASEILFMAKRAETKLEVDQIKSVDEWETPESLYMVTPDSPVVSRKYLPSSMADWIENLAGSFDSSVDFIATSSIAMCSGLLGRKVVAKFSEEKNMLTSCNMYYAAVGRPGSGKSPMISGIRRMIIEIESEENRKNQGDVDKWEMKKRYYKSMHEKKEKELHSSKDGFDEEIASDLLEIKKTMTKLQLEKPIEVRKIVSDITMAKLQDLLSMHPEGLILNEDEIDSLIKSFGKQFQSDSKSKYLTLHNGTSKEKIARMGREAKEYWACLSIVGGIQPDVLIDFISEPENLQSGLVQRFVFCYPKSNYINIMGGQAFDQETEDRVKELVRWLINFDRNEIGELVREPDEDEDEHDIDSVVCFSPGAIEEFRKWNEWNHERATAISEEDPVMSEYLIKCTKRVVALSLTFQMLDYRSGPVSHSSVCKAIWWNDYFNAQFCRLVIDSGCLEPDVVKVCKIIQKNKLREFTARDIVRASGAFNNSGGTDKVREACVELEEMKWIVTGKKGGHWYVNELVHQNVFKERAAGKSQKYTDDNLYLKRGEIEFENPKAFIVGSLDSLEVQKEAQSCSNYESAFDDFGSTESTPESLTEPQNGNDDFDYSDY